MKSTWEELELAQTADIAVIKSAYAKKLKVTKPDEDPVAFQNLHAAYKAALRSAKSQHVTEYEFDEATIIEGQNQVCAETNESVDPSLEVESSNADDSQRQIADLAILNLLEQCDEALNHGAGQHDSRAWSFLNEDVLIIDPYVNNAVGSEVFDRLATYNARLTSRRKARHQIQEPVLNYLDNIFNWSTAGYYYGDDIHEDLFEKLMTAVSREDPHLDADKALSGVRGARVIESKVKGGTGNKRPDQEAYLAHKDISQLATIMCAVALFVIGLVAFMSFESYNSNGLGAKMTLLLVPCLIVVAISAGVFVRHEIGYYGMWGIALILLPLFPLGTAVGWFMGVKLNKAKALFTN